MKNLDPNDQRFINVNKLYESQGDLLCRLHPFAGDITIQHFIEKERKHPIKLLLESQEFQKAFSDLDDVPGDKNAVSEVMEKFVFHLYVSDQFELIN